MLLLLVKLCCDEINHHLDGRGRLDNRDELFRVRNSPNRSERKAETDAKWLLLCPC